MSDNPNIPEVGSPIPQNAVSLYGQGDAMDDFPVLKAFQQYVDAEHAKAQKRMTTLCVFFVVLMVAVIGVFVALLMSISSRNNALSDQLFQFMLKDRDRQNVFVQPPAAAPNDAALKAMADMQNRMMEQQMKFAEEMLKNAARQPPPAAPAAAPEAPVSPSERAEFSSQKKAHEKQVKTETDKLKKAQAALKAEKDKLAKEKERLRQKEIDLQRRKLYPDLYGAGASASAAVGSSDGRMVGSSDHSPISPSDHQTLPDDDYADLDAELAREERAVKADRSASPARADGSIRYFSYDDDDLDDFVNSLETPAPRAAAPQPAKVGGWDIPLE